MSISDSAGIDFTRAAIALALGQGRMVDSIHAAESHYGAASRAAMILRAVTGTSTPASPGWGSELVADAANEFFDLVAAPTVAGQLVGMRRVPIRTRVIVRTGAAIASWVGQGQAKPFTGGDFEADTMDPLKVVASVVVTDEMLRLAQPDAERVIRDDLVRAATQEIDRTFVDPANNGTAGEAPAAITHGAGSVPWDTDIRTSLAALIDGFTGDLSRAFLVADPVLLSSIPNDAHPNIGARGGELQGIPTLSTDSLPRFDSPQTHTLALIDPAGIAYAEGEAEISVARQASVSLISEPGGEGQLISLWQANLAALRVERFTNWRRARTGSVRLLTGIPRGAE